MAKRSKTPAQIKAEMAKLTAELKQAEAREGERIGVIAIKAGLHELDVSDADLTQAFKDIAARFRTSAQRSDSTA